MRVNEILEESIWGERRREFRKEFLGNLLVKGYVVMNVYKV